MEITNTNLSRLIYYFKLFITLSYSFNILQLVNSMLSVANKLDSLTLQHEAVKTVFERGIQNIKKVFMIMFLNISLFLVGDILKYSDPLCFNESEALIPNAVKYQLILSEEENLKEALDHLKNLEILKSVLDSQPIKSKLLTAFITCF